MAEGRHSSEPEKAHPSSELNIVAKNGDPSLLRLACSLANVVRQAGRQTKICFSDFLEIKFQHFSSRFLIYNAKNKA